MDRLLQFVIVLTIATSSYSYVYQRHEPEMPDTPPEFELDDNYPTEYIEALVDALNPEELQRLRSVIDLHHRTGTPSSSKCLSYNDTRSPHEASDEFGIRYYIIHHSKKLPEILIDVELCNYTNSYNCITEEDDKRPTYANCCINVMEMRTFYVLSIPVKEFHSNTKLNGTIIQKDLYIRTRCECESKTQTKHENDPDVCQLSENDELY